MKDIGEVVSVSIGQLLLDPNNYRFLDMGDYVRAEENRYHEETVQEHASNLIHKDGADDLKALKESIKENGYLPLDTLIVRPYNHLDDEDLFVVVEGNRRVEAMKWLVRDKDRGVAVNQDVIESFKELEAIKIETETDKDKIFQLVLLGVRHVSGIKEWGGYQRAKVILEMVDDYGHEVHEASDRLNMTTHEAMRRYRAIKALKQMQDDEEFGSSATPDMYRLFHEAVSVRKVKEWLGWNDDIYRFEHDDRRKEFYKMLVPYVPEDEEGEARRPEDPKITTYKDVRSLREILGDEDAEEVLLDSEKLLLMHLLSQKLHREPIGFQRCEPH